MKFISITPLSPSKREFIAKHRLEKKVARGRMRARKALEKVTNESAAKDAGNAREVDALDFSRALSNFRSDLEVLPPDDQEKFRAALYGYMAGSVSPEKWHQVVSGLKAAVAAAAPPQPKNYFGSRRSYFGSSVGALADGW